MRRKMIGVLLAMAFLGGSAMAAFAAFDMSRVWGEGAVCSIPPQTGRDLSLLTALYPGHEWTAYAQYEPVTIQSSALPARTAQASVLSFLGRPEKIAFFPLASGRLPLHGERGACALDKNTASCLFKSRRAEGGWILVDGKTVRVVGVMDVDRPLLVIPAAQETRLNRLSADNREEMLSLASALKAEADPFELSGAEMARLSWLLCALPWFLTAALALTWLRGHGGWRRTASTALFWALVLGAILALLWCVPVRLLPARWSDMGFYKEQAAAFRARPYRAPDIRDELLKGDVLRTGLWCAFACAQLWMERMWLKCGKPR